MKYIAVFDLPDGYAMGCACGKMAQKGKDRYEIEDFENVYAQIEPLSEEKAEIFERFNVVHRVMSDLGLSNAYDMPSFWCNKGKSYTVIPTKYHKGYMQALEDVEREIRMRFGFAEREDVIAPPFFSETKMEEGEQDART